MYWDDPIPGELLKEWHSIYTDLEEVKRIRVPRWIHFQSDIKIELHGFGDASEKAIAAVIYLCVIQENNSILSLVTAKTKVAPVKSLTTARLELCAALLLAKLANHAQKSLNIDNSSMHLWSDSTVALAWIRSSPHRWQTFVSHRSAEISRLVPSAQWHHIDGDINPADAPSRGRSIEDSLIQNSGGRVLFLLRETTASIFKDHCPVNPNECSERRKTALIVTKTIAEECPLITRFSSYSRLIRVLAWMLRFIAKVRSKFTRSTSPTTLHLLAAEVKNT